MHYSPSAYAIPFYPYPFGPNPYYANVRAYGSYNPNPGYMQWNNPYPFVPYELYGVEHVSRFSTVNHQRVEDHGTKPYVVNIEHVTKANDTYRTAIWTGKYFQVTVMSINVGDDIGLEVHPTTDQFIRIEQGQGLVQMGDTKDNLSFTKAAHEGDAIMVPAGQWHNVTNTGNTPLKVYVIYAPPHHPFGTVQQTKAEAMASD
ncbi:MAG: cupin [Paenibacillus sp.]|nr:cupin [Paenibacillus sp.]